MMTENTSGNKRPGKLRALLAGGLVLGVGGAVTLAAWNDSEFAEGTFEAGSFNLAGSTDGADFVENPADDPAALAFTVNPNNLAPGDTVTAPFAVRLDAATSYDAAVTVTTPAATPVPGESLAGLTYELTRTTGFGCDSAPVGAPLVPAGSALGTTPGTVTFDLAAGEGDTIPGAPVNLCFEVLAGAITQGQLGSTTWEFAAESQ